VCGSNNTAFVFFWTDASRIPKTEKMPVGDMRAITATYERNPWYSKPELDLAAWLYPTREAAQKEHAFFAP